jgi:hypothetical protein
MNPSYIEGKFVGFMKDQENIFLTFVIFKKKFLTFFKIHCGYLEIETINPLSCI